MTAYNGPGRIKQMPLGNGMSVTLEYDAQNRRVKQKDYTTGPLITTEYVYTGSQVIEEYKDTVLSKTFVYADYIDDPIVMTTGSDRYYYVKDRQYAIKAVTDDAGVILESYEYSAYGVMTIFDNQHNDITATGSAIDNPYGYTGRRWDSYTGLW